MPFALAPNSLAPLTLVVPGLCLSILALLTWQFSNRLSSVLAHALWVAAWLVSFVLMSPGFRQSLRLEGTAALLMGFAICCGSILCLRKSNPHRSGHLLLLASGLLGAALGYFSSSAAGPDWMVQWFTQAVGLTPDAAYTATVITRKLVHFNYFGFIAQLAFYGAIRLTEDFKRSIAFALLWTATFAAFDELSQLASPKRTGSFLDFGLDMLG